MGAGERLTRYVHRVVDDVPVESKDPVCHRPSRRLAATPRCR